MRPTKSEEASETRREHLIAVLSEQVRRTFATEGPGGGRRLVEELVSGLDESALRELAYRRGVTTEFELEPENDR